MTAPSPTGRTSVRAIVVGTTLDALRARPRQTVALLVWSGAQLVPTFMTGYGIARALDDGFLVRRPAIGLAWLAATLLASVLGARATQRCCVLVGDIVEPFRDVLVRRVVSGAVGAADGLSVTGSGDRAAVSRLTHQIEMVRDTYAGLLMISWTFAVSLVGVVLGVLALAPALLLAILPPFALGLLLFATTVARMARRQRAFVLADEHIAAAAASFAEGLRDLTACGGEERAYTETSAAIEAEARATRGLARLTAVRTVSLALGAGLPMVLMLAGYPWLTRHGVTVGGLTGALTYVSQTLQPTLRGLMRGFGGGLVRIAVALGRIIETCDPEPPEAGPPPAAACDDSPGRRPSALRHRALTRPAGNGPEPDRPCPTATTSCCARCPSRTAATPTRSSTTSTSRSRTATTSRSSVPAGSASRRSPR